MTISNEKYQRWLQNVTDAEVKEQLCALSGEQIENAFFKDLSFGTGGLRGILGAGTNSLNVYTIDKATEGIARVLERSGAKKIVVNCDSRINSRKFAERAACVYAAHGLKVEITADIMPVSFLSFAIREQKADAGVMITASHNPAIYNGYKVYENDGCQCTDEKAALYSTEIDKVDEFSVVKADWAQCLKNGEISYVKQDVYDKYYSEIDKLTFLPLDGFTCVYSPLNGAGYKAVPSVLARHGAKVTTVPEQAQPDGHFPTCPFPNPEKREALKLGLALAEKTAAPLLVATDPDCDRVGIAVRHKGAYVCLTGNEVGALLADFVLSRRKGKSRLFKTIVTSDLGARIAENYGAEVKEVLTGFKYIGEQIGKLQSVGKEYEFAMGYEESYGYLLTPSFRDKDGVGTCYVVCQMAAEFAREGKTLVDGIEALYAKYGFYDHRLMSFSYPGASGFERMQQIMHSLREKPLTAIGTEVLSSVDYLTQTQFDLPRSDVLSYTLQNAKVIIRPSGTEPMIKIYLTTVGERDFCDKKIEQLQTEINKLFK